jgi:small conductance mechanosensitive channel
VNFIRSVIPKDSIIEQLLLVVLIILLVKLLNIAIRKILERASKRGFDRAAIPLISDLSKYALYVIGLLLCLNIMGVNTNGLLAMIGAASLAVGLALKDTLSNVAAGILLLFLKPFCAGDYIECGTIKGKISGIGMFNTTFETMDGLYVSAPNSSLWGAPIVNYSRNLTRRLDLTVGVAYKESLDRVLRILREMVAREARFLKIPVPQFFVSELADNSVNITIWVWVNTYEYHMLDRLYREIIKNTLDEYNIEIPFPQRVVHMAKEDEAPADPAPKQDEVNELDNPDSELMQIVNGRKKPNGDEDHFMKDLV